MIQDCCRLAKLRDFCSFQRSCSAGVLQTLPPKIEAKLYKNLKTYTRKTHIYTVYVYSVVYTVYQFCFCNVKAIKGHTYLRSVHEFVLGVSNKIPLPGLGKSYNRDGLRS